MAARVLLALGLLCIVAFCAQAPKYDAGVALFKAGRFTPALEEFLASERSGEVAPERQFYIGVCLARRNDWVEAAARLAPYAAAHPADPLAWYWLGQVQLYHKQFSDARASIERSIGLDPNSADAYRTLGEIEIQLKNNDGAYRAWLRANRLDPKDSRTTYYLGRLFFEADVMNESAAWLRETLKLSPNHFAAMTYLAMCAERLNMQKTAIELYVAAIAESKKQNKPFPWAFLNYSKLLRQNGKESEALALLEEGEKICPEAFLLTALGQMLATRNESARAEAVLRRAIDMDATIPDAHYRLALLLRLRSETAAADAEMARFREAKDAAERNKNKIQAVRKAG